MTTNGYARGTSAGDGVPPNGGNLAFFCSPAAVKGLSRPKPYIYSPPIIALEQDSCDRGRGRGRVYPQIIEDYELDVAER
jgi:hypothetical protein